MLALGQDRAFVAADPVQRPAAALGDLLGARAGPDLGLHLARPEVAGHLDLELAQVGAVAAHGSPQRLVDSQEVLLAVRSGQQQVLPVLVDADQSQVMHKVRSFARALRAVLTVPSNVWQTGKARPGADGHGQPSSRYDGGRWAPPRR